MIATYTVASRCNLALFPSVTTLSFFPEDNLYARQTTVIAHRVYYFCNKIILSPGRVVTGIAAPPPA